MGNFGNFDFSELKNLQNKLNSLGNSEDIITSCAKEIAARLMARAKELTPVGDYRELITVTAKRNSKYHQKGETYTKRGKNKSGNQGGNLRRNWKVSSVERIGNTYYIEISNPEEYASYVEYGHRQTPGRYVPAIGKKLKKSWVPGRYMLKISTDEIRGKAPEIIERKIRDYLRGVF